MENTNAKRADWAMNNVVCNENFQGMLKEYTIALEEETGEILFFLPLDDLHKANRKDRKEFLDSIEREWIASKFEIMENREASMEEWCDIGFDSHFFRLKSVA